MRFALLGNHVDGLEMARALTETGRHELALYCGPALAAEGQLPWGLPNFRQKDMEEVLADPSVELLIVAGPSAARPAQLRRALQSERHVLCVHPADGSPDVAYEAAMIQGDTGMLLLPLLPESLHPAFRRLAQIAGLYGPFIPSDAIAPTPDHPLSQSVSQILPSIHSQSPPRLLECERWSLGDILLDARQGRHKPGLPGWDVFRLLGGEIAELQAFGTAEELEPDEAVLLSGQFVNGGLFRATYLPNQPEARWRLTLDGPAGRAELLFPTGWPGPAHISFQDEKGQLRREDWPAFHPWSAMVLAFEESLGALAATGKNSPHAPTKDPDTLVQGRLGWLDAIRALELDDAARRSIARRRASTLDFQEMTEEAGFKGTMTLVGCTLLWVSLMLLIMSIWVPWLGWLIAPVFAIFLMLQLLRWVVPGRPQSPVAAPLENRNMD